MPAPPLGWLSTAHLWVGLALAGEPGTRLAERLAITTSPDTLLRRAEGVGYQHGAYG